MRSTTPYIALLTLFLSADGANAASLSLGVGGLTTAHTGDPTNIQSLFYTDPSGITIEFANASQADYSIGGAPPSTSRGWNNDPSDYVVGHTTEGLTEDHLAISHFFESDDIRIDFSGASGVMLNTVRLVVWDLDTNTVDGVTFTETFELLDANGSTLVIGAGSPLAGNALTHLIPLGIGADNLVRIEPNVNEGRFGTSAFTLTFDSVPDSGVPDSGTTAFLSFLALGGLGLLRRFVR